jgi:hypothetical protein
MIKTIIAAILLALLAACRSTPRLEDDARYVHLATVMDIHEFTEIERKQAQANRPSDTHAGVGIGVGAGSGGSFGVMSLGSTERIEVMSRGHHKMCDCVKVLAGQASKHKEAITGLKFS